MVHIKKDGSVPGQPPIPLVGCGILKKEIQFLVQKNHWPFKNHFLCSSLHIEFEKLGKTLVKALHHYGDVPKAVIYGTCHPSMDTFIEEGNAMRSQGQNCVELLLGKELFEHHLSSGAFFIMEDWAKRWQLITGLTFGNSPETIKEIIAMEHTYFLGIETPCSGDFRKEARCISKEIDLPLEWVTVPLDPLEKSLTKILEKLENLRNE